MQEERRWSQGTRLIYFSHRAVRCGIKMQLELYCIQGQCHVIVLKNSSKHHGTTANSPSGVYAAFWCIKKLLYARVHRAIHVYTRTVCQYCDKMNVITMLAYSKNIVLYILLQIVSKKVIATTPHLRWVG